jgi:hypothetical protein
VPVLLVVAALLAGVIVAARTERPVEKPVVTPDLCAEFAKYVQRRRDLLERASSDLEQATSPTKVIERLIVTYPVEFSQITRPFIETVIAAGGTSGDITDSQLAKLGTAENLRALGNGRPFIFDGETGAFDPAAVPNDLWQPAELFSESNRFAAERCSSISGDVTPGKARLASAVYSSLANPDFMEQFYSDPASLDLIDAGTALVMATMAWGFFDSILVGHYDWFLALLERNEEVRRALAVEYPEVFLTASASAPELAPQFLRPEWKPDIIKGIKFTSPASRAGLYAQFPGLMTVLGV